MNDLDELNRLGFGADVDKLESYSIHLLWCKSLGVEYIDEYEFSKCLELLKKLKPESPLFITGYTGECRPLNQFDKILTEYNMTPLKVISSMSEFDEMREQISGIHNVDEDANIELCAYARYTGLDVRLVYSMGYLVQASLQSRFLKGDDITECVKHSSVPQYVEDWKRISLIELRGVVTLSKEQYASVEEEFKTLLHAVTSLVGDSNIIAEAKKLDFVLSELLVEHENEDRLQIGKTRSNVKDYLDELGFMTPECVTIGDISYYNFDESIQQIIDYFKDMSSKDDLGYEYTGIDIVMNSLELASQFGYRKDGITLNAINENNSKIYDAEILSIEWEPTDVYMQPYLRIEKTITVDGDVVERVRVNSLTDIERLKLYEGSNVKFKFSKDSGATLCMN